jgi:hypothetical protein
VDAPQQAGLVKLSQIPPNRVGRDIEGGREVRGQDPALTTQPLEDVLVPFLGKQTCTIVPKVAGSCKVGHCRDRAFGCGDRLFEMSFT